MIDNLKIGASLLLAIAAVVGYYQLPSLMGQELSILVRVGFVLAVLVASAFMLFTSSYGTNFIEFYRGAMIELRKMVWPSRPETFQATGIIVLVVIVVALFLWLVDFSVFNVIYNLVLGVES